MLVTGSNTVLNIGNHSIFVGYSGTANQLTIQNGAAVSTITGFIGYNAGSSNNAATVTGPARSGTPAATTVTWAMAPTRPTIS